MTRFVVGTGRCGSTLLSRMLGCHADVAAIHECFTGLDWGRRFQSGTVEASDVAALLAAEQPVTTRLLALGYRAPEITYPFDRPGARWTPGDPLPWLLVSMATPLVADPASRFHGDPDALFEAFLAEVRRQPAQPMAAHYRALFAWLAETAGKTIWVERSGSSIAYVGELAATFDDARFCHIHRDGVETALSLRAHPFFRFAMALLYDLLPGTDLSDGGDEAWIRRAVDEPTPVEIAGRYWADQLSDGYRARPDIADERWLDVCFEDLVTEPRAVLARIAAFFALPDDAGFLDRAAGLVAGPPPLRAGTLDAAARARLDAAVRPGRALLAR